MSKNQNQKGNAKVTATENTQTKKDSINTTKNQPNAKAENVPANEQVKEAPKVETVKNEAPNAENNKNENETPKVAKVKEKAGKIQQAITEGTAQVITEGSKEKEGETKVEITDAPKKDTNILQEIGHTIDEEQSKENFTTGQKIDLGLKKAEVSIKANAEKLGKLVGKATNKVGELADKCSDITGEGIGKTLGAMLRGPIRIVKKTCATFVESVNDEMKNDSSCSDKKAGKK